MKTLGIIGFGNFGRFAARHLKGHFDVLAFDQSDIGLEATEIGVKSASLKHAAGCDVVLLCVPVQNMEAVLTQIKTHLKSGAVVLDVCSVKQKPAALMQELLPKTASIIGTHPLFGPQSGQGGIQGLEIVLCPVRAEKRTVEKTRSFLRDSLGLRVLDMTPAEHDGWMARTQALAHFVGRAAKEMDLSEAPFHLATYDALLKLRDLVKDDSDALFETIQNENPDAAKQRRRLVEKMNEIEKRVSQPKRQASAKRTI